jgi:hypothetical protein
MSRPTSNHAGHDEILLARLFGGDVDERERTRALDLIGSCPDCAAFYADLRAIAQATSSLPVPPRPRDFTLTEADAVRLRPARKSWLAGWAGRSRLLGSSMVALGALGIVFVGTLSALTPATPTSLDRGPVFAAATAGPAQPDTGQENGSPETVGVPLPTSAATAAAPTAAATGGSLMVAPSPAVPAVPSPSARTATSSPEQGPVAVASPGPSGSPESVSDTAGKNAGATEGTVTPQTLGSGPGSGGQPDARIPIAAGCAVLLAAGFSLLIGPALVSRVRRASR